MMHFAIIRGFTQDKTLFFLPLHPQSSALNPSISYNRSFIMVNPSLGFTLSNSALTFHKAFNRGKGEQDTLLFWDFDKIERKLKSHNYINAEGQVHLFFAGKTLENGKYASFSVSKKYHGYFSYPRSFVFLRYGNADLANNRPRPIDLDNYSLHGSIFNEYSFGYSKPFSDKIRVGAHFKLLQGELGIKTTHFFASVTTSSDFSSSTLQSDAVIELSAPIAKKDTGQSEFDIDMTELKDQVSWFDFSLKNLGAAVDLGITWDVNDKIKISGSLIDLGFIHWGKKPQQLISKGRYLFDGLYFSTQNLEKFDAKNYFNAYTDTIRAVFLPQRSAKTFVTWLNAKTYLGGSYQLNNRFSFNGLIKTTLFYDVFLFELTAGAVYRPNKKWGFSGNWSYSNFSLFNFGLGVMYTGKRYQLFAVTDNINAIAVLDSKGANISAGINFLLFQDIKGHTGPSISNLR
jgi:hypothetical protein